MAEGTPSKAPSLLKRMSFGARQHNESRVVRVTTGDANKEFKHRGNAISTGKYNPFTFFPKALYEQFRRVANMYFLSVAIISLFDAISPIKPYTIWSPLVLVIGLSMTKEAVEDYARHKQDHQQNISLTERFNGTSMSQCEWRQVVSGDIVRVVRDQSFPCDIVLLASSLEDSVCYVETKNLDGETNLKIKRGVEGTGRCVGPDEWRKLTEGGAYVECEHPNNSLYTFTGNIDVPREVVDGAEEDDDVAKASATKKISVVPANVLLRGSCLRNTEWVVGVAIYAGHDTKVMMNSSAAPSKRSQIELGMDTVVLMMLGLLFLMGTVTAIVCGLWIKDESPKVWYLRTDEADMVFDPKNTARVGIVAFLTSYVLYGYLIPISLYVSLEFVKVTQAMIFINGDREMHHAETDTPARARTSNLNEELGMVHTVLSDKTGTLTCNSMEFFKCSIAGTSYGNGFTEIERSIAKRSGRTDIPDATSAPIEPGFNFTDARVESNRWMTLPDAEDARDFFRVLAVCHTVIPEGEPVPDRICYQAESPDESAFVVAAKRMGFFFKARVTAGVDVDEFPFAPGVAAPANAAPETKRFEVLNILEFNSTRKRMSVVARTPEGKIVLYCKGADSIIYERLKFGAQKYTVVTQEHMDEYAASGLRTLCLAKRELSESEYAAWNETYVAAAQSLEKRDEKIDAAAEEIEKDLYLLGATAIEDKLQTGVPGCIEQMMSAGIAVWVLTGDKQDTAINIGQACSLIRDDMDLHVVNIQDLVKAEAEREITRDEFNERGRASVTAQIQEGIERCDAAAKSGVEMGLVIDGRSLSFALEPDLAPFFLSLGSGCASVVCCRVSPLQKALVTGLVKDSGRITLAIGDGANDVGMIQAAHIGVGISGQEGMQAVMASDFAFAQFRYLERLLLVHGRYNYKRISRMVTYFFYKNLAFGLTLFMYNLETRASGQVVYNDWLMSGFNIFFVSLPVLALGCLDQDVNQRSCLQFPQLYRQGQQNACFTPRVQMGWALNAVYVAVVTFCVVFYCVHGGEADHPRGHVFGLWEVGTSMYTAIVIIINLQMGQMINYWTWLHYVAIFGSIVIWYVCNVILSNTDPYLSTYSYKIFIPTVAPTPKYWAATPLVVAFGLLPDLVYRGAIRAFRPEPHHLVQEYERRDKRLRASGASVDSREGGRDRDGGGDMDRDVEAAGSSSQPAHPSVSGRAAAAAAHGESYESESARESAEEASPERPGPGHRRRASAEKIDVEQLSGSLSTYSRMRGKMESKGQVPTLEKTPSDERQPRSAVVAALDAESSARTSVDESIDEGDEGEEEGEETK